jgi:hypothetical protein
MEWIQHNWVNIVALLWSIDQILKVVAAMTDNKVIDNLSDGLGKLLARFLPQK